MCGREPAPLSIAIIAHNGTSNYKNHLVFFLHVFRNITIADIKKEAPLTIIGEPTLKEAATKYIQETEYALFKLPEKMTNCSEEKIRQFCSIVFQVKHAYMHDCMALHFILFVIIITLPRAATS